MKLIVKIFGLLILFAGISLLIKPEIIIGWLEGNTTNTSLYIIAIVARFLLGILFIAAARESKYPVVMKVFGYLFLIAAIIFVFIGHENFQGFMSSVIPVAKPFAPLSGILSIAFGVFLMYAFSRNKETEQP